MVPNSKNEWLGYSYANAVTATVAVVIRPKYVLIIIGAGSQLHNLGGGNYYLWRLGELRQWFFM